MKLSEISTWITNAKDYWYGQLDARCNAYNLQVNGTCVPYSNLAALKTQVDSSLNTFQSILNSYVNDSTRLDNLKNSLLSLYTYAVMKNMNTDPPFDIPSGIQNEDFRNLFKYFSYNLGDTIYTTFFTISDVYNGNCSLPEHTTQSTCDLNGGTWTSTPTTQGLITNNSAYDDLIGIFNNFIQNDKDSLDAFAGVVSVLIREKIIFNLFREPNIIPQNPPISNRERILNHMYLWQVLQTFNWTIDGVQWDDSWVQV